MPRLHRIRRVTATATVATLVAGAAVLGLAAPASATSASVTFTTGSNAFTVPAGVDVIHVEALGGSGGNMYGSAGGAGGLVSADLPVTAGDTYTAVVGGNGEDRVTGGANGGGQGASIDQYGTYGAGGGGATDLRTTPGDLGSRVLVAAGGGGGQASGGVGGAPGEPGGWRCSFGTAAQPGTATAGGSGGDCPNNGTSGTAGTLGAGGDGGVRPEGNNAGSGGGGGLYGGGGGSPFGAGAGGSNSVTPAATNVTTTVGSYGAAPFLRITYLRPALTGLALTTSAPSITADGTSTLIATARLTNVAASTADGEDVRFTSDAGNAFGPVTDNGDGSYSATLTSTTTAKAAVVITATADDGSGTVTGTTGFAQTAGPTASVAVAVAPGSITANGTSTASVVVTTADAFGNTTEPTDVTLSASNGAVPTPLVSAGPGRRTSTVRATTTAGTVTLTATDSASGRSGQATLTQVAGATAQVVTRVPSATVVADGTSPWSVTTTVTDANDNGKAGVPPTVTTSDPGVVVGATTDNGDGTYTTALTPSTTLGTVTITATTNGVRGSTTYRQVAGTPDTVRFTSAPVTAVADGATRRTVTATVTDAAGHPLSGLALGWTSSDTAQQLDDSTDNGDGTYSVTVRTSTTVGTATLTSRLDDAVSATQTITQTVGVPSAVTVSASRTSTIADGATTTEVTAVVADGFGHPVDGRSPVFTASDRAVSLTAVTALGDGRYRVTMTASKAAGTVRITVTDGDASGRVAVEQLAGRAAILRLTVGTPVDQGNGTFVTPVTATVTDANGNPVRGAVPTFVTTDPRSSVSNPVDNGDGTYSVSVTAPAGVSSGVSATLGDLAVAAEVPAGVVVVPVQVPTGGAPSSQPVAVRDPGTTGTGTGTTDGRTLAYTGSDGLSAMAVSAIVLLVLGTGVLTRRRRTIPGRR